jgi:hypothetical protein
VTENYFNYFTETEEHFQRARGTGLFLLSPLDWALIEAWKNSGIPLEAVLHPASTKALYFVAEPVGNPCGAFSLWRPESRWPTVAQAIAAEAQAMAACACRTG